MTCVARLRFAWLTIALASCASTASAQTLAQYSFSGLSGTTTSVSPTTANPNINASDLTRGAGLGATSGTGAYVSNSFSTSTSLVLSNNDYLTITLTPNAPGGTFSFSQFSFTASRSSSGPTNLQLYTNINSTLTAVGSVLNLPDTSSTPFSVGISGVSQSTPNDPVEFRLYGYTSGGVAGTLRLESSLTVTGTITPVPEPTMLLSVVGLGIAATRLRRRLA